MRHRQATERIQRQIQDLGERGTNRKDEPRAESTLHPYSLSHHRHHHPAHRQGQVWIRIFPDKPITRKPADVRMGKGKGDPAGWVAPVTPGRILFEVEGVSLDVAKEALRLAAQKLPVKTKFVIRRDYDKNA